MIYATFLVASLAAIPSSHAPIPLAYPERTYCLCCWEAPRAAVNGVQVKEMCWRCWPDMIVAAGGNPWRDASYVAAMQANRPDLT